MRARLTWIAAALFSTAALALLAPACDGGGGAVIDENADADGDGFPRKDDCDDGDPAVNPDATEPCSCDGEDDDCNGMVDDFECALACYPPIDADGDGFEPPADCNDQDPAINPTAEEPCLCDNVDADCSGDPEDFSCDLICYDDNDGDGFDEMTDCDDGNGGVNPGAQEECECDSTDQNCNGSVTDIPAACGITCTDADGDGFFAEGDDCDDGAAGINPGAMEACACDNVDSNCSGDPIDFDCDMPVCMDGDGDGSPEGPDCDDTDDTVAGSPDPEACSCDGKDNNCDGTVDDFDAACMKTCTYLMAADPCTANAEPGCGAGLACCGTPAMCVTKCVGANCMAGCPVP
jgi:hypothetical protein